MDFDIFRSKYKSSIFSTYFSRLLPWTPSLLVQHETMRLVLIVRVCVCVSDLMGLLGPENVQKQKIRRVFCFSICWTWLEKVILVCGWRWRGALPKVYKYKLYCPPYPTTYLVKATPKRKRNTEIKRGKMGTNDFLNFASHQAQQNGDKDSGSFLLLANYQRNLITTWCHEKDARMCPNGVGAWVSPFSCCCVWQLSMYKYFYHLSCHAERRRIRKKRTQGWDN